MKREACGFFIGTKALFNSVDGSNFVVLYTAPNPTYLGNSLQQFLIDTPHKYNYYKLMCIEAEEGNPGLSYFQLLTLFLKMTSHKNASQ